MDEVAAAVGVTKPLLYTYFGNKEQLFLACMTPAGDALRRDRRRGGRADGSTRRRAARRHPRVLRASSTPTGSAWRVLFDETLPAGGEIAARAARVPRAARGAGHRRLLARPPAAAGAARGAEVEALSVALLGAAEALGRWWLRTGAIPAAEAAELLIATVEPGLRNAPPAGASETR